MIFQPALYWLAVQTYTMHYVAEYHFGIFLQSLILSEELLQNLGTLLKYSEAY